MRREGGKLESPQRQQGWEETRAVDENRSKDVMEGEETVEAGEGERNVRGERQASKGRVGIIVNVCSHGLVSCVFVSVIPCSFKD